MELINECTEKYSKMFPEAYVKIKQLSFSSCAVPIEVRLKSDNLSDLRTYSDSIVQILRQMPELMLVRSNMLEPLATTRIKIDDEKASRLGITNEDVELQMAFRYGEGLTVSTAWEGDYDMNVKLKTEDADQATKQDVMDELIPIGISAALPTNFDELKSVANSGSFIPSIPLRQFAEVVPTWQYGQICHRNGLRIVTVMAEVARGENDGIVTKKIMERLADFKLPEGMQIEYGGQYEADNETGPQIASALVMSIMIIFFVLLWHFKNVSEAVLIMVCLTLCVFGMAVGLVIQGVEFSMTSGRGEGTGETHAEGFHSRGCRTPYASYLPDISRRLYGCGSDDPWRQCPLGAYGCRHLLWYTDYHVLHPDCDADRILEGDGKRRES